MEYLDEKLIEYEKEQIYPFHMPGHKRIQMDSYNPYQIDITEIDGFDNLSHAKDILKEAQERANELFGAKKTFYLVNGSTCGLLAAISAVTKKQDKVILARNCHKSVYHAVFLNELKAQYLYPNITEQGIQASISSESVKKMLEKNPDVKAVIITSPTYDGVVSDIKTIADIVHEYKIPLIVDEAHGSHFGFHEAFPKSALELGADLVIHSLHKTFPSLTQTALLHINSNRVDEKEVQRYLDIFQTSSPSYVLMASMERCIRYIKENQIEVFSNYIQKLERFKDAMQALENIKLLDKQSFLKEDVFDFDCSKVLLSVKNVNVTGYELLKRLLKEHKIQLEMASIDYATALTSVMDSKEGFFRLEEALKKIDSSLYQKDSSFAFLQQLYTKNEKAMELHLALSFPQKSVMIKEAVGEISAEYIYLYPPGIPFLIPGEIITKEHIKNLSYCVKQKVEVEGLLDMTNQRINIVNF